MQIKSLPEDFIVDEINTLHFDSKGTYSYYQLKKSNIDHHTALQTIADAFHITRKYINIAGIKDKHAITTQYLSISQGPKKDFKTAQIELTFLGRGKERISLGMLDGNRFTITIRNITKQEMVHFEKNIEKQKNQLCIPNYHDDQRFGVHKDNAQVGKLLLKRRWKEACIVLKERETTVRLHLHAHPSDSIGALRTLPKQQLRMYLHSYQSYLWNETVKELMKEHIKLKNEKIPIIGFDMECRNKKIQQIIQKIMKQEDIKERDFIFREIPELSSSGGERMLFLEISDFSYRERDAETKVLHFSLKKGSYATVVVKALFS